MSNEPDSLHRSAALFAQALELPAEERDAFLERACADEAVRERVRKLLQAEDRAEQLKFLPADSDVLSGESCGRIGRYRLIEKLGEGGWGVVYVAEQEEPVRRRVALKVIKLGMDTRRLVARFEAERQALAMMDHPNIAKVLDAGATDSGRPYFVMELVRGTRITQYCDQHQLSTEARLELFIQVCRAVQHAHQKGIIHRDLKPSNILVTLHDGLPVPKVIDFGIAKATEGRLTEATVYTEFHQFIGTPAYMSPEQAEMNGLDIDTRSDVYSLGVLLYELLTGRTPFDTKELMSKGLDALRKTIREKEPVRPSTRLTQELAAFAPTSASASPALTIPTRLEISGEARQRLRLKEQIARLQGDLDWIVMKCLEKDRGRRYDTANDLVADLQRHLGSEPVLACPPSRRYRLSRLVRRNRLTFAAASAIASALCLGLIVASCQTVRATRAELKARLAEQDERAANRQAQVQRDRAIHAEVEAHAEALTAKEAWAANHRRSYAAEMNVAFEALRENNLDRALELLNRQNPAPGEEDLRGFEWRCLWDLCRSDARESFPDNGKNAVAFSPDGRFLAYADDQRIIIRDSTSNSVLAKIPQDAWTLAFAPHADLLASSSDSGVVLWDTRSWKETRALPGARLPAVFSPDGHWLVTGTAGGFRIWNAETWEPTGFCPGEPIPQLRRYCRNAVAFTRDGRRLVTPLSFTFPDGTGNDDPQPVCGYQVWEFPSLKPISRATTPRSNFGSATFTPDGRSLLIGTTRGTLMVWNIAEGEFVQSIVGRHLGWIAAMSVAPDGRTLATASEDRSVIIWDLSTLRPLTRLIGHLRAIYSLASSPNGSTLASGSADGTTKLWDPAGVHTPPLLRGTEFAAGFSSDSRVLVVVKRGKALLWDLSSGELTSVSIPGIEGPLRQNTFGHATAVYGPEPILAFGRTNGSVELWNLRAQKRITAWSAHREEVTAVAISADKRRLATGSAKGKIKVWDLATKQQLAWFPSTGGSQLCLAFSPDGRLLTGAGASPKVWVWDIARQRLLRALASNDQMVISIAFSPDGKLLASCSLEANEVRLWQVPEGALLATLKGHIAGVTGVAFTPDGKTLATGSHDRRVKLWNVATQQQVGTLPLDGLFWSFAFSPDGRLLAASYLEGDPSGIRLWRAPSFEEINSHSAQFQLPPPQFRTPADQ